MRIVLDTNVLVSAALKQESMSGMTVLAVQRHGCLLKHLQPNSSYSRLLRAPTLPR
jgi:predicted nucleic acid-binding protein